MDIFSEKILNENVFKVGIKKRKINDYDKNNIDEHIT